MCQKLQANSFTVVAAIIGGTYRLSENPRNIALSWLSSTSLWKVHYVCRIVPRFKGGPKRRRQLAWKRGKCASIFTCRPRTGFSLNSYATDFKKIIIIIIIFIMLRMWSLQSAAVLVRSWPMKSRKKERFAHDVIDTCATHAGLVHDVKNTYLPERKRQSSLPCFYDFQTEIFNKLDLESTGKTNKLTKKKTKKTLLWVYFIPFLSI